MRVLLILAVLLVAVAATADIINVPDDASTIQAGINAASPGDTVLVADGTYNEAGIVMKPGILLMSASDDSTAVIIDPSTPPIMETILIMQDCGDTTEVRGLTLARGLSAMTPPYMGGAIRLIDSSPRLTNIMITDCQTLGTGGGIYMDNSSPTLTGVTIKGSLSTNGGGGMACINGSNPTLTECTFIMNSCQAGGNVYCNNSSPEFTDCDFHGGATANDGDGLYLTHGSSPTLINVSFGMMQSNLPNSYGQCVYMEVDSSPDFMNVCFYNSGLGYGPLVYAQESSCAPQFSCCNCFAWGPNSTTYGGAITDPTGLNGNISMDPMYCDAVNWDLRVDAASPNLPQSPDNECGSLIGRFSQGCDSPVEATSWGSIKSIYR